MFHQSSTRSLVLGIALSLGFLSTYAWAQAPDRKFSLLDQLSFATAPSGANGKGVEGDADHSDPKKKSFADYLPRNPPSSKTSKTSGVVAPRRPAADAKPAAAPADSARAKALLSPKVKVPAEPPKLETPAEPAQTKALFAPSPAPTPTPAGEWPLESRHVPAAASPLEESAGIFKWPEGMKAATAEHPVRAAASAKKATAMFAPWIAPQRQTASESNAAQAVVAQPQKPTESKKAKSLLSRWLSPPAESKSEPNAEPAAAPTVAAESQNSAAAPKPLDVTSAKTTPPTPTIAATSPPAVAAFKPIDAAPATASAPVPSAGENSKMRWRAAGTAPASIAANGPAPPSAERAATTQPIIIANQAPPTLDPQNGAPPAATSDRSTMPAAAASPAGVEKTQALAAKQTIEPAQADKGSKPTPVAPPAVARQTTGPAVVKSDAPPASERPKSRLSLSKFAKYLPTNPKPSPKPVVEEPAPSSMPSVVKGTLGNDASPVQVVAKRQKALFSRSMFANDRTKTASASSSSATGPLPATSFLPEPTTTLTANPSSPPATSHRRFPHLGSLVAGYVSRPSDVPPEDNKVHANVSPKGVGFPLTSGSFGKPTYSPPLPVLATDIPDDLGANRGNADENQLRQSAERLVAAPLVSARTTRRNPVRDDEEASDVVRANPLR